MNVHLPIDEVDKFVEIAVSKRLEWKVSRRQYKGPEKIVYSLTRKGEGTSSYAVRLYPLDRTHTKIEFPVPVKESHVVPSPFDVGGTIEVAEGGSEVDEKIQRTPIYKICHSIWLTVGLQEYLRAEDIDAMEKSGDQMPLKPSKDAPLKKWFEHKKMREKMGLDYSLKQLAKDASRSYGYVRTEYPRWKRTQGNI